MTNEELKAIEDRASAATPGPWRECGHDRGGCTCGLIWSIPLDLVAVYSEQLCGDEPVPDHKANSHFIAASRSDIPALCAAVRERDAASARLTAEGADHARHVLMDMLDAGAQEIANANGNTAEDIAAHVRFILDHRGQEIARLRRVLVNVSTCLLVSTDPLSIQMRTGIDLVLAKVPS